MTPIIFEAGTQNFDSLGLGLLPDGLKATVTEELNGKFTFEMIYPVDGRNYTTLQINRIVKVDAGHKLLGQAFVIRQITQNIDMTVSVYAEHISYLSLDMALKPAQTFSNLTAEQALQAWKNQLVDDTPFVMYSDITTQNNTAFGAPEFENARQALGGHSGSILDVWGGEYEFDNWYIRLWKQRGKVANTVISYGRNLTDLSQETSITDTYTSLYPYMVDKDHVKHFLPELVVDTQYVSNYPNRKIMLIDFSSEFGQDESFSETKLRARATSYINSNNVGVPKVSFDVSAVDLSKSVDYTGEPEQIDLADAVSVYFEKLNINATAQVTEVVWNVLSEQYDSFKLGARRASLSSQIAAVADTANETAQQAKSTAENAYQLSANGKHIIGYLDSGDPMPDNPKVGDTIFMKDGDDFQILEWDGITWVAKIDPNLSARIDDAVAQANAHTDDVKQSLSTDITTAKSQAASQASTAEANAKSAATSQFTQAQSALSAAKSDLTNSIASEASARNTAVAAANSQAQSYANQAKADTMSAASSADGVIRTEISSSANSLSATITQNKSEANGKISTAQTTATQALNGLSTKVSQTDYNNKTGQLQTDLTATTQTANQAQTDIVSIKSTNTTQDARMTQIEADANGTKTTVSNLQTTQNSQAGSISTLQQRADGFEMTVTKVTNLSIGSRNYFGKFNTTGGYIKADGTISTNITGGDVVSGTIQVSAGEVWQLTNYASPNTGSNIVYALYQADGTTITRVVTTVPVATQTNRSITIPAGATTLRVSAQHVSDFGINVKVEKGTIASDWSPAPEDQDAASAKAQLTADEAKLGLQTYKTDADGRITKAQTDINATAQQVATKVSQTDYNAKTNDLTTKVTTAQQTADAVNTSLASYKTSADGRISANTASNIANANAIAQKVSQSDYNANNQQLTSRLTTVETTANGTATTVSNLQQTVNNLGQVNQLFNTEFSPDLQGWYASPNLSSQSYPTTNTLLVKSNISYSGSNAVMIDYSGQTADYAGYTKMYPDIVNVYGHSTLSWRMAAYLEQVSSNSATYFNAVIDFFDKDMTFISNASGNMFNKSKIGVWQNSSDNNSIFLNVAVPANAYYAGFKFYTKGQFKIHLSKPMLVFDSPTVGVYVAGAYNNSAALAQVKITADNISNFVKDANGNLSSTFQNALSKTSIITGSTLATSIQQQTSSQITSALTDNNGKIISLINQDASGVQIAGKNITLDGNTTVTGDFYAKGGNFKNLNASNINVGTLNGNQVNITNINASNIVTGNLTGITLMSSANGSQFKVQGNNLQMIKQNGDNLQLSTDGLFWKDSSGNVLFEASNKITTSDIFGTAEYNVYLASLNETRSVTYATALTGSGGVSDYNYVPHRSGGIYTTWVEVNASGGAENVYIRPLTAQSEVRITASGGTDAYANLRARYVYANRIGINSRTDAQQLYLQTGDEVRIKSTNDDVANSAYKAIRASAFNNASLAKYKQNIEVSGISGLDEINKSTIYNYQLKTTPDKQEVGLVIGDGYDISQVVVDGDGVNQYRMVALAWKAIQELAQQINDLKQELD